MILFYANLRNKSILPVFFIFLHLLEKFLNKKKFCIMAIEMPLLFNSESFWMFDIFKKDKRFVTVAQIRTSLLFLIYNLRIKTTSKTSWTFFNTHLHRVIGFSKSNVFVVPFFDRTVNGRLGTLKDGEVTLDA